MINRMKPNYDASQEGTPVRSDGREAETRKPEDRLHSTSHFFSHPHTSQNRDGRPLSHSEQCNPESHTLIPSATMAALCVSDATQNQSHPLLFLNRGGGRVGVFCWKCSQKPQEDGRADAGRRLFGAVGSVKQPRGGGNCLLLSSGLLLWHLHTPASVYSSWIVIICHFIARLFTGAVNQSDCVVLQNAARHQSQQVGDTVKFASRRHSNQIQAKCPALVWSCTKRQIVGKYQHKNNNTAPPKVPRLHPEYTPNMVMVPMFQPQLYELH